MSTRNAHIKNCHSLCLHNIEMINRKPVRPPQQRSPIFNTAVGRAMIIEFKKDIPEGWRKMTIQEGRLCLDDLRPRLTAWSIVGFEIGALVGTGYGGKFWEHYGGECGEGFILEIHNQK